MELDKVHSNTKPKRLMYYDSKLRRDYLLKDCMIQYLNCFLLGADSLEENDLWVRDGQIQKAEQIFYGEKRHPDLQIDCDGCIIAPGFIEMQINGGFGFDFTTAGLSEAEYHQGVTKVASGILAHGVTAFCPTLITTNSTSYHKTLPWLHATQGGKHGAAVLGAHVEGPFISAKRHGAHPVQFVQEQVDVAALYDTYGPALTDNVRILTIAPELPGAVRAIEHLSQLGVCVSIGHSCARMKEAEAACAAGARCVTHLFNAMDSYHHRDPSLIGLLASEQWPNVHYGIIADGIHTHNSALRIAHRSHPHGLVLTTDAVLALGMPDGLHSFGDIQIEKRGNQCVVVDHKSESRTLAGSVASMDECVRQLQTAARCSAVQALHCASAHVANMLQLKDRGTLQTGARADLVLLTRNLQPRATFISGQLVYAARDAK